MDLWDEDLYLMQCGPPRKVWKWKNNTIILVERKKKAYESFAHDFLFKIWKKFNRCIYIYIWITVSIQIIFCTERRVRQSDPLAPLFFILGLKILACEIRQDNNIEGIRIYLHSLKIWPVFQIYVCYYVRLEACLRFSGEQCEKNPWSSGERILISSMWIIHFRNEVCCKSTNHRRDFCALKPWPATCVR